MNQIQITIIALSSGYMVTVQLPPAKAQVGIPTPTQTTRTYAADAEAVNTLVSNALTSLSSLTP